MTQGKFLLWRLIVLHLLLGAAVFAQSPAQSTRYRISGQVRDAAGRDVAGAKVCAARVGSPPGEGIQCTRSMADGQFTLRLARAGHYLVIVSKDTDGYMPQVLPFFKHSAYLPPEVTLDDENDSASASPILAPKNGALTVKALDAKTLLPVEDFRIIMCRTDMQAACFASSGKNAEGRLKLFVAHTPFTLRITADGYEDWLGLNGALKMPVSIASGEALEVEVYLRRRDAAFNQPLSETEKQVGVNLPAPVQLSPADGAVFDHYPRKTTLEWAAVEGAASYTVEVDFCRGGETGKTDCVNPQPHRLRNMPLMTGIQLTSYEFNFLGAQPGRWRVWAVDKEGREGFKSQWRAFAYTR